MLIKYDQHVQNIKNLKPLSEIVDVHKVKYSIEDQAGIYSFWFNNSERDLCNLERSFFIKGPGGDEKKAERNWNLDDKFFCLYIGKTTRLKKRVSEHLLLKTASLYNKKSKVLIKKTTTCQLRTGFDFLYHRSGKVDIRQELKDKIYFSFIEIDDFIERFYAEDYLIGYFRPWFNIDSER